MMSPQEKARIRLRFRVAAFIVLVAGLAASFTLDYLGKSGGTFTTAYGAASITLSALIVADYTTTPKET